LKNKLTSLSKKLRRRPTEAEKLLWRHLRRRQVGGLKFRRQEPIGNYIVDFVCFERRIIVEVDGGQHAENKRDEERDKWLKSQGFKILRFWNNEVLQNMEGVLEVVRNRCLESPSPIPSHRGRGNGDTLSPRIEGGGAVVEGLLGLRVRIVL